MINNISPSDTKPPSYSRFIIFLGFFSVVIVGFLGFLLYKNFYPTAPEKKQNFYQGKIVVSWTPWPGNAGFFIADAKGFFVEEGLNVELKEYADFAQSSKDYTAGKVHIKGNLTLDAVKEAMEGFDHQVVLVMDYSNGADAIISSPEITDFSQIKGKKVAYNFETLEEFFLNYALLQNNLTLDDIEGINLSPEASAQALVEGKVDVAVTWEPYLSTALKKIHANLLYSSADTPGLITDISTINKKFIEEYPDSVEAFIRAYFKAIDFLENNPEESHEILARTFKTSPEDIKQQLKGIKILNAQENKTAFTFAAGPQSLYGNIRIVKDFLDNTQYKEGNQKKRDIDTYTLINDTFIKKLLD